MTVKEDAAPGGVAPHYAEVPAPVIAEVLSGATKLSYIFALVPEILVWGGGALLIRELVRRWGGGWTSVILLGIGLAIAEEFVIQQTSIAPYPGWGIGPLTAGFGDELGVFPLYAGIRKRVGGIGPGATDGTIFPKRRDEPWLRSWQLVSFLPVCGGFPGRVVFLDAAGMADGVSCTKVCAAVANRDTSRTGDFAAVRDVVCSTEDGGIGS